MDYIKIRFSSDFDHPEPKFEKTLEDIFRNVNPVFTMPERIWKPQMDIYETLTDIYIIAEIAGVKKEELDIEINRKAVKIQGSRNEFLRSEKGTYRLAEVQYGRFERTLYLPSPVDTENVQAFCQEGFLKIRLGKIHRRKTHKIQITGD